MESLMSKFVKVGLMICLALLLLEKAVAQTRGILPIGGSAFDQTSIVLISAIILSQCRKLLGSK